MRVGHRRRPARSRHQPTPRRPSSASRTTSRRDRGVLQLDALLGRVADARSALRTSTIAAGSFVGQHARRRGRRSTRPRARGRRAAPRRRRASASAATSGNGRRVRDCEAIAIVSSTPERRRDSRASSASSVEPARRSRRGVRRARVDPQPHVRRRSWSARWARRAAATSSRSAPVRGRAPRRRRSARAAAAARRGAPSRRRRPGVVGAAVEARPRAARRSASALTIPTGTPARARSVRLVDVHLDEARQARAASRGASTMPLRVDARGAHRLGERHPVVVATLDHASATSSFPASALLPNVGVLKRAPSSSANEITASGAAELAAISNPQATPSGPSNRPPPRTLSRCEPDAPPRRLAPRGTPTGCRPDRARRSQADVGRLILEPRATTPRPPRVHASPHDARRRRCPIPSRPREPRGDAHSAVIIAAPSARRSPAARTRARRRRSRPPPGCGRSGRRSRSTGPSSTTHVGALADLERARSRRTAAAPTPR